ncbi:hypothetical protein HDU76_009502 [Blyttiomyces sp. JEL0837]|nr:hypothetical protein HDU76_009502 [Blyttiomyces sp. JEL0837]
MAPVTLSIEYGTDLDNTSTNNNIHIWASNLTYYNLPFENDTRGRHMIRVDFFDSNDGSRVGNLLLINVGSGIIVGNSATKWGSVELPIEIGDFGGAGGAGANAGVVILLPKSIVD